LYGRADYLARKQTPRVTREQVDHWFTHRLIADADAHYDIELTLDLATVIPHVSGPNHVKTMASLPEIEKKQVKIDKAYLLSCVKHDLRTARRQNLAARLPMRSSMSRRPRCTAERNVGIPKSLVMRAHTLPSGCGPCIGLAQGRWTPAVNSATNRNFQGRMGHRDAATRSPAVVAFGGGG
jgi:homoaconitate hydratase